jgi:hypothetical protein
MRCPSAVLLALWLIGGIAWAQATSPSAPSAPPAAAKPPTPTPSQQNLDMKPPASKVAPGQDTTRSPPTVVPPQPGSATQPSQADRSGVPPPSGKRPQPTGANSSQKSQETGTGKNPANESLQSCLGLWEPATHMSKREWARACRRVDARLRDLSVK